MSSSSFRKCDVENTKRARDVRHLDLMAGDPPLQVGMPSKLTSMGCTGLGADMDAQHDRSDQAEYLESGESTTHLIPIDQLLPGDSPRLAGEDEQHSQRLIESESELPPILVHRPTMHVIDGMHRLRAAKKKGHKSIRVAFFDGGEEEAFVEAVRANISHGLPLSLDERRSAAERIISSQLNMSDRALAECTGLSTKTVGSIRKRLNDGSAQQHVRIGKDGRRHPLSSAAGRRQAAETLTAEPHAPLRHVAKLSGVSVGTAKDVRERIRRGEDPVAPRDSDKQRDSGVCEKNAAPSEPPATHPERPPAGPSGTAPEMERKNMQEWIASLKKDPSLRSSESGRELLRWLHLNHQAEVKCSQVVNNVPPHLAAIVAKLATQCSEIWQNLAQELQEREV
ncbi:ParB-like chromosome segregation protein Spo0J [Actinopolyspora biskrensis]|uniref:ParB-like chromosome segregation protein Spo0J n=1 Tax=Actinopolyspora biskrensis TaxID=1470178 RepID=A0A852Z169_9ACTN|nr:ParB/RepB/Spo0J family partition protein [Actinopolyspora biskrensis]NYH80248.1 ParB-like chromosome segregation protein Spo0J [Actinopolyspora biskrensis]